MSENLEKAFIKTIIQSWLKSLDCTSDSSNPNCMYINNINYENKDENGFCKTRFGMIQFYDRSMKRKVEGGFYGDIMELSVYEVRMNPDQEESSLVKHLGEINEEPAYYLHFEMHDFEFVLEQLNSFFSFLYETKEEESTTEEIPEKMENILICCTCGLTSGYYASLLKNKLDQDYPENHIHAQGANVNFLPNMIDDYDVVFLAPQIYYMEKELKTKYGNKIQLIDRTDFTTFKFGHILNKLYPEQNQWMNAYKQKEVPLYGLYS